MKTVFNYLTLVAFVFVNVSAAGAAETAVTPTEAQIAGIVKTANEGEVKAAKTAEKKASDKEVKDFASHMIHEHTKNTADFQELAKKLKLKTDLNSATVKSLNQTSQSNDAALKKVSGPAFYKIYMEQQIAAHQTVLAELEGKLIPNAQNQDFKNFLENTKSHVEEHLKQAQNIQTKLTR